MLALAVIAIGLVAIVGMIPHGIQSSRDAADNTDGARLIKRQIEQSIIYLGGVLGHYAADLGNPMHCTVHFNGWAEGYPNPKNFPVGRDANGLHSRFESNYVNNAIE
jgi:hypothetical protein